MNKPNIILILSDQHRGDWLGCAGNQYVNTPNIDRLAEKGVHFTNTCCSSPLCGPSRMSMLTGRHPYRNGVYINEHTLSSDVPTFLHSLGIAGYETVLCGRMHFMGLDQRHGFQKRLVGDICGCYSGGPETERLPIMECKTGKDCLRTRKKSIESAGPSNMPKQEFDITVTEAFEKFIKDRKSHDKPLCVVVGYYLPHAPYCAPREFYEDALKRMNNTDRPIPLEGSFHPWLAKRTERTQEHKATTEQTREVRANYAGMISYLDTLIGRVLKTAEKLPGETLTIYTSDHGESAGDHKLFAKCNFYEEAVKVPLIFAPLKDSVECLSMPAGTKITYPTSLLDISPTLVELTGAPDLPLYDGVSLAPLLATGKEGLNNNFWKERSVFSELATTLLPPARMILKGKYKLVYYHSFKEIQLFDLKHDPNEQNNLADSSGHEEIRSMLLKELFKGWDVEWIVKDVKRKMMDLRFMETWGLEVGMGKHVLWK